MKKAKKKKVSQGRKGRAETSSEEASASESSSSGSESGSEAEAKRRKAVRAGLGGGQHRDPEVPPKPPLSLCPLAAPQQQGRPQGDLPARPG